MAAESAAIQVSRIQASAVVLAALIAAVGSFFAGRGQPTETTVAERRFEAKFAPGILVTPATMSKEECGRRMIQEMNTRTLRIARSDADAGRALEGDLVLGFWCAKRNVLLYYGVAPDRDEANRGRQIMRGIAESIGAVEAPPE